MLYGKNSKEVWDMSKTRAKTSLPISATILSPNFTKPRRGEASISRVTPHHMGGNMTIEACLGMSNMLMPNNVGGLSVNYAIGSDGRRGLGAEETKEAWTSANRHNDARSITFEIANNGGAPNWNISDAALESWVSQVVESAKFYGFRRVIFVEPTPGNRKIDGRTADQVSQWLETQRPADSMLITLHRFFTATSCPGPYFESRLPEMIVDINNRLNGTSSPPSIPVTDPINPDFALAKGKTNEQIVDDIIQGLWGNGEERINRLTSTGLDAVAIQKLVTSKMKSPNKIPTFQEYQIRSNAGLLNVREGPGVNTKIITQLLNDKSSYTIIDEIDGPTTDGSIIKWGKLKNNDGYIALMYTLKI